MKKIIALQEYTDKYVSFYEGEIRNIEDKLADQLIEKGIVAEHSNSDSENRINIQFIKVADLNISSPIINPSEEQHYPPFQYLTGGSFLSSPSGGPYSFGQLINNKKVINFIFKGFDDNNYKQDSSSITLMFVDAISNGNENFIIEQNNLLDKKGFSCSFISSYNNIKRIQIYAMCI